MKRRHYKATNSHLNNYEMTNKQYKTLRYLVVLWFKAAIHHKFRIVKNTIFLISICGFAYYYFSHGLLQNTLDATLKIHHEDVMSKIQNVYHIENYESVSRPSKSMKDILVKLQAQYFKDRAIPDDEKYAQPGVIKKAWRLHCYAQLRKIVFLKARISDIEQTILYLNYNKTDLIYDIYTKAGYDEVLSDLSNYYSRFLTEGQYSYIIKGFE